ncbi:serine protease snake-like, partial [Diaphorina citri]|uniref:Serine protease snake-like n=1 Tax=Diaphorina citri TaxID=121845 RepID=A0A3Q0IV03_DIACI
FTECEEYSKPYTQTINALPLSLDPDVLTINVGKCDRNAQALIVGGQKSELGEFPHMAAVGFRTGRGDGLLIFTLMEDRLFVFNTLLTCSLVSEKFVLTAAHCTDSSLGKPVSVRLGELNLVRNDDGASPENFKVVQVYPHPDYRSNVKYNDIALLRLDRTVEFSNSIRPACLYTSETTSMPRAIATGWGTVGFVFFKLTVISCLVAIGLEDINFFQ